MTRRATYAEPYWLVDACIRDRCLDGRRMAEIGAIVVGRCSLTVLTSVLRAPTRMVSALETIT
jgi:hypothetical protein